MRPTAAVCVAAESRELEVRAAGTATGGTIGAGPAYRMLRKHRVTGSRCSIRLSSPRRPATDVRVLRHFLRRRAERSEHHVLRAADADVRHRRHVS